MTVEDRLRADAVQQRADDPAVPSFDATLSAAVTSRRPHTTWFAVAASVALVAAIVGVVAARPWHSSTPPAGQDTTVPLPKPPSIVVNGTTFHAREIHPMVAYVDPSDATIVRVVGAWTHGGTRDVDCLFYRPSARLVDENGSSVTIAAFDYQHSAKSPGLSNCTYAVASNGSSNGSSHTTRPSGFHVTELHLAAPLGTRRLVDTQDGSPVAVVRSGYLFTVSYVPSGMKQAGTHPMRPERSQFTAMRTYSTGGARHLDGSGNRRSATSQLTIMELPQLPLPPGSGRVDVNGHRGLWLSKSALAWPTGTGLIAIAYSDGPHPLSRSELIRVARGVH